MTTRLHNYAEVRAYLEKEHLDWLRALTPRRINAPAEYSPQKVLAVSSVNAAMQNYVSIREHRTRPNPALAEVHGQAALLLPHEVPTYYVSRELLAAALRTELPDDMTFEAVPFPSTLWSSCCRKEVSATQPKVIVRSSYFHKLLRDRRCPCRSKAWTLA